MKFLSPPKGKNTAEEFPLLPMRELVLFPHTIVPVYITYKSGITALEEALKLDSRLFAACLKESQPEKQENSGQSEGEAKAAYPRGFDGETYSAGTVVRVLQHIKLPDHTFRVVLQGEYRGIITGTRKKGGHAMAMVEPVGGGDPSDLGESGIQALTRAVQRSFAQYAEFSKKISTETITSVEKSESPERMGNLIANALAIKPDRKVELLRIEGITERLEAILETLETENEIYGIQKNISGKVKNRMEKNQREYILYEQLKEINKELGKDGGEDEFAELERVILEKNPGDEVLLKARKEIARLKKLQALSPEAGVLRGYLEWIGDLPWSDATIDSGDLGEAERILNEDHFDMKKAKERILEFIAVRQLVLLGEKRAAETPELLSGVNERIKGPILCFVGPPGTGKTSLGKSVARALGRSFVRISLGGVRDEAEIRGHRKTYVGALPGKIIQSMRKAGTVNPVFLLDEIDKLSSDFRGDPASALLEVLDPEQNSSFTDHYMEVPYDLSRVLFIATANSLHTIPYALLDRMEIIEVPGYGEMEKLAIAKQFLVPKELTENSLAEAKIQFKDEAILELIRHWTMESGVRSLEREIAHCIRRIARYAVEKGYGKTDGKPITSFRKTVRPADLEKLLGRRKYKNDVVFKEARIGVSYGLAWTETGGAMLPVETISYEGKGDLIITGNLGDVMKESARIALSYLRSAQGRYNFKVDIGKADFHVHVPEGAIPKDGPSAGITLAASLLSTLCAVPPKSAVAMTGELTLTGRILPIGGLKEKLLAAIRNGMERVLLPTENRDNWEELDKEVRDSLKVDFVETADEAFAILFTDIKKLP
ncbi:endopeptidase La [Treponema primitia ZAS-2]|uniref:Lon protease n=1 Tax=Treponema primitia (strain ATCC BAA-887 / DSM 12427 / ZAS-2) TaxID=545694 RepID=F5YGI6_TREPZ|nr:endopeptidase La [Treponema primitia]AEF85536.1 endopeptidase La [Treponema primitia ZAS-2]